MIRKRNKVEESECTLERRGLKEKKENEERKIMIKKRDFIFNERIAKKRGRNQDNKGKEVEI